MSDVLFAVAEGEVDLGVVPIENAIEGTVNVTSTRSPSTSTCSSSASS